MRFPPCNVKKIARRKFMKLLIAGLLITQSLFAQVVAPTEPLPTEDLNVPGTTLPASSPVEEAVEQAGPLKVTGPDEVPVPYVTDRSIRAASFGSVMLGYQLLSSWIPSKTTLAYTHRLNQNFLLEAEYGAGSVGVPAWIIDVAQIKERRYSLLARHFMRDSFHFIYGASFNRLDGTVGSRYLESAGAGAQDAFNVQGYGITLGMGNRWQWRNGFTLGIDWFRTHIPLINRKADSALLANVQSEDRSEVRDAISVLRNIPTFVLLGVNLGYSF
jgi:hypothetical protein